MNEFPVELARLIKMVIIDVDGVMTDGGIYMGITPQGDPLEMKRFEITDGLGVKMLSWAGLQVHVVSGRASHANRVRARELEVSYREAHGGFKVRAVDQLRRENKLEWPQVCCIGDDLADLPIMQQVGLPVSVANGVPEIKAAAKWTTQRKGGDGAVRELAETLLKARGEWEHLVDNYCRERGI